MVAATREAAFLEDEQRAFRGNRKALFVHDPGNPLHQILAVRLYPLVLAF